MLKHFLVRSSIFLLRHAQSVPPTPGLRWMFLSSKPDRPSRLRRPPRCVHRTGSSTSDRRASSRSLRPVQLRVPVVTEGRNNEFGAGYSSAAAFGSSGTRVVAMLGRRRPRSKGEARCPPSPAGPGCAGRCWSVGPGPAGSGRSFRSGRCCRRAGGHPSEAVFVALVPGAGGRLLNPVTTPAPERMHDLRGDVALESRFGYVGGESANRDHRPIPPTSPACTPGPLPSRVSTRHRRVRLRRRRLAVEVDGRSMPVDAVTRLAS